MENRTIIFITGLPASGKTTLGSKLAKELDYFLMDGPEYTLIVEHSMYNLIVAGSNFCLKQNQERIKNLLPKNIKIKWLAFENDPEACYKNNLIRKKLTNKMDVSQRISDLSKLYTYPSENCEIIPVWKKPTGKKAASGNRTHVTSLEN